jgi:hypothetical protein
VCWYADVENMRLCIQLVGSGIPTTLLRYYYYLLWLNGEFLYIAFAIISADTDISSSVLPVRTWRSSPCLKGRLSCFLMLLTGERLYR